MQLHTGQKNFICDICQKTLTQKVTLNQHLKVHPGEKPHQCESCEKSFSQKAHLKRHMTVHTGEKTYSCEGCGNSYTRNDKLHEHKKKCYGQLSPQRSVAASEFQYENDLEDIFDDNSDFNENRLVDYSSIPKSEYLGQQEMSGTTSCNPYLCVECWNSFSIENDFTNHKTTCQGNTSSLKNSEIQFVNCDETVKQN